MGTTKERCPKCKQRRRRSGVHDSAGAGWTIDPELGRGVCPFCAGQRTVPKKAPLPTREERHAEKQPVVPTRGAGEAA